MAAATRVGTKAAISQGLTHPKVTVEGTKAAEVDTKAEMADSKESLRASMGSRETMAVVLTSRP